MAKIMWMVIIAAILIMQVGCTSVDPASDSWKALCFGAKCVNVEVADDKAEQEKGLMYRESLADDAGMLFVFDKPDHYRFWMKNMLIPLDMIFLDADKKIVHVEKNVGPCNVDPCPTYGSFFEALYIVEVTAGFAELHGLENGNFVSFEWP